MSSRRRDSTGTTPTQRIAVGRALALSANGPWFNSRRYHFGGDCLVSCQMYKLYCKPQLRSHVETIELHDISTTEPLNAPPSYASETHDDTDSQQGGAQCKMAEKNHVVTIAVVVVAVLVVIVAIIVSGIQTVDYYDLGLLRRKSTGHIDVDKTYTSTRMMKGPDYDILTFPATAQFVNMKDVSAVSKNNQHIVFKAHFQYFIRREELGKLYENHKFNYHGVIQKTAVDSIKDTATSYRIDEFIDNREAITDAFFEGIRQKLEGICCLNNCETRRHGCLKGCKDSNCTESEKGLYIEVRYFQLGDVDLNTLVKGKKLRALILSEEQMTKEHEQKAALVRKETDRQVRLLSAQTNVIKEASLATSNLIHERANARYISTLETSRAVGLKRLYDATGLTDEAQRSSFDYLRTIQKSQHINLAVGFTQYITGNIPKG